MGCAVDKTKDVKGYRYEEETPENFDAPWWNQHLAAHERGEIEGDPFETYFWGKETGKRYDELRDLYRMVYRGAVQVIVIVGAAVTVQICIRDGTMREYSFVTLGAVTVLKFIYTGIARAFKHKSRQHIVAVKDETRYEKNQ